MDELLLRKRIKEILQKSDLSTVSAKNVRLQLETVLKINLSDNRKIVDKLVMEVFEEINDSHRVEESSSSDSDVSITAPPAKKTKGVSNKKVTEVSKPKKINSYIPQSSAKNSKLSSSSDCDSDADDNPTAHKLTDEDLARQLQAEELGIRQTRRSQNKSSNGTVVKQRTKTGDEKIKKTRKTSTFGRTCILSNDLRTYLGEGDFSMPDLTKRMWNIAKENDMFDPKNKQFVICDDKWQHLFKVKRIRMFAITKYLKKHAKWPADE